MSNLHLSQRSQRTSMQRSTRSQDIVGASAAVASPRRSQRNKKPQGQSFDSEQVVIKDEEEAQLSTPQSKRRSRHVGTKKAPDDKEEREQKQVHKEEQEEQEEEREEEEQEQEQEEEQEEKLEEQQVIKRRGLQRRNREPSRDRQDSLEAKPSDIETQGQEEYKYLLTTADLEMLDFKAWQVCEVLASDDPIESINKQEARARAAHWDVFEALKVGYTHGTNFIKRAGFPNIFPISRIDNVITRANIATFMHMLVEARSLMEAADALFRDVIPRSAPKTEVLMKLAVDLKSMAILDEMMISTESGKELSVKDHLDHHFPESPHDPLGWGSDGDGISGSDQWVQLQNKRRLNEELYLEKCLECKAAITEWLEENEGSFRLDFTRDELIKKLKDALKQVLQTLPQPFMGKAMENISSLVPDSPHTRRRRSDRVSGVSKQKLSTTLVEDWSSAGQPNSGDETDDESIAIKDKRSSQTSKSFDRKEFLRKLIQNDPSALAKLQKIDPIRPSDLRRTDSDEERDTSIITYDGPNSPTLTPKRQQPKTNETPLLGRVPSSDKEEQDDGNNKRQQGASPQKKQRTRLSQMVSPQREIPEKKSRVSRPGSGFLDGLTGSTRRMNEIVNDPYPQVYKDVSVMQTERRSRKSLDSATVIRQSKGRSVVRESFPPTGHRSSYAHRDDMNDSGGEGSSRWSSKKWDKRDNTATRLLFNSQGSAQIPNLRQPLQPQKEQRKHIETQKLQNQHRRIRNESIRAEDTRREEKKIKRERQPIRSMSDMENAPSDQVLVQRRGRQTEKRKRGNEKAKGTRESPRHNHIQSFNPLPEHYENELEDDVPRHRLLRSPRKKHHLIPNLNDLPKGRPQKRRRWTEDELKALEEGMERFGTRWNKIRASYLALINRDQVQLKDKARTERARRQRAGIPLGVWEDGCTWIREEEFHNLEGSETDRANSE